MRVKAVVAKVEGYKKRFTLVTSAVELSGLQMVELFATRFRQEDGFRDLKGVTPRNGKNCTLRLGSFLAEG